MTLEEKLELLHSEYLENRDKFLLEELKSLSNTNFYSADSFINIIKHMDLDNEDKVRSIFEVLFDVFMHKSELIKILNYDNIGARYLM